MRKTTRTGRVRWTKRLRMWQVARVRFDIRPFAAFFSQYKAKKGNTQLTVAKREGGGSKE